MGSAGLQFGGGNGGQGGPVAGSSATAAVAAPAAGRRRSRWVRGNGGNAGLFGGTGGTGGPAEAPWRASAGPAVRVATPGCSARAVAVASAGWDLPAADSAGPAATAVAAA
ncbi:hypothetical protein BZL30_7089 [Mycobacterium kansasii]|uniref:Uncharacterized protein n=1 Tax=Mycobacterium kansasii TaxID=1768 RepID=A0A1V3WQ87_MYCKA|nr:hypothetical protein BZL30_7089 [Mycobacterium kansasii]